jgi:hypothetical protein
MNAVSAAAGLTGSLALFALMLYNLYTREPNAFYMGLALATFVLAVELLYIERDVLEPEVEPFDPGYGGLPL